MGIYYCNKCGHLSESIFSSLKGDERPCIKCNSMAKKYDTLFFIQRLMDRYFSIYRELQVLKKEGGYIEDIEDEDVKCEEHKCNILNDVDVFSTNILTTTEQHGPLKKWFSLNNIVPYFDFSAVDMSGYFDEAAINIGDNYDMVKFVIDRIGWAYRNNRTGINIDLSKVSQKDGQIINNLCRQFYSYTFFSNYFYQKQEKIIHLGIQSATAIKDFFSGEWLEWFALGKILTEARQKGDKYVFSCARRIKIQFSNEDKHELDAMILPEGGTPVVIECKSGEFRRDIKKYILLKKKLNLPRSHFIILTTDIDSEQSVALSKMYDLTFLSLQEFKQYIAKIM